jgi:hypothetical protein
MTYAKKIVLFLLFIFFGKKYRILFFKNIFEDYYYLLIHHDSCLVGSLLAHIFVDFSPFSSLVPLRTVVPIIHLSDKTLRQSGRIVDALSADRACVHAHALLT